jgi:hypothetical protein
MFDRPLISPADNLYKDKKYITTWLSAGWSTSPLLAALAAQTRGFSHTDMPDMVRQRTT